MGWVVDEGWIVSGFPVSPKRASCGHGWRDRCGWGGRAICTSFLHRKGTVRPDLRHGKGKGAGCPVSLIEAVNELSIGWFTGWDSSAVHRSRAGDHCILASDT